MSPLRWSVPCLTPHPLDREALGVLLCQKLSHDVRGTSLFSKGRFLFYLPAAGRLSTQIYSGPGMYVCTFGEVWGFCVGFGLFFWWGFVFFFFFLKEQCCSSQQLILNLGYLTS